MKPARDKRVLLHLPETEYEDVRKEVLYRDGWRCQFCGSMKNLEVHHQQFRSHLGRDTEENLITICANCHSSLHSRRIGCS